jgi:hypothetical protein
MMQVTECSTIVVEDSFIEQGPGLQSFAEIAAGVEYDDGGIPGINSFILAPVWHWVMLMPILRHNH